MADDASALLEAARSAFQTGRNDEAEALLRSGVERFPRSESLACHYGWAATERGDWEEAAHRWAACRARFPTDTTGYLEGAKSLNMMGRPEEADVLLASALARFPDSLPLHLHYGWAAGRREDWDEAARRWKLVWTTFPDEVTAYLEWGIALRQAGRAAEADLVLAAAVGRFPENVGAAYQFAVNAKVRCELGEQLKRWTNGSLRFPADAELRRGLQVVRYELQAQVIDDEVSAPEIVGTAAEETTTPAPDVTPWKTLFDRFESLGENCEFGFVQRHFGSEPLSLLRWGYVSPEALLKGLDSGFDGVGDPRFTMLDPNPSGELILRDTRYFSGMHTFTSKDSVDQKAFHALMCKRLSFLRRKMIRDLSEARQIFVYKRRVLSAEVVNAILAALRRYGPNRLLVVSQPGEPLVFDSGTLLPEGLMVDSINLTQRPLHELPDHQAWLRVCQRAGDHVPALSQVT